MSVQRTSLLLLALAGAVIVLLAYRALTTEPAVVAESLPAETITLPARSTSDPARLVASLEAIDLWGLGRAAYQRKASGISAGATAEAQAPAPVRWRLTGTYSRGAEAFVLVSLDGRPAEPLRVGDSLPGGARILEIGQDRICILINGRKRALEVRTR